MSIEFRRLSIMNRITKLEDRGGNANIVKKLRRELSRLTA